jgi:hypothetical protein
MCRGGQREYSGRAVPSREVRESGTESVGKFSCRLAGGSFVLVPVGKDFRLREWDNSSLTDHFGC